MLVGVPFFVDGDMLFLLRQVVVVLDTIDLPAVLQSPIEYPILSWYLAV